MAAKSGMLKLETRALKYGYSNARARAMKGLLLPQSFLEELIRVGTIDGMAELLQKTGYKNELAQASVSYSGSALIEAAAARNFAATVRKLIWLTPKSDQVALKALLIRWDLTNLKTLMHAKRLKKSYEDVKHYLFDVGGMDDEDFKRIMKADEGSIIKEIGRTEVGQKMLAIGTMEMTKQSRESFANAMRNLDTFMQMETIIDAYIYMFMDRALAQVGGSDVTYIRNVIRKEIDAKNVMIIERLKRHNVPKERVLGSLLKGGTLDEQTITSIMEAKDIQGAVAVVKPKFHKLELKAEKMSLTDLEIAFEKSIAAQKAVSFHRSVLSLGVIVGFLLLKEEETNNIRKIAKGKEFRMSEDEVRDMLVIA